MRKLFLLTTAILFMSLGAAAQSQLTLYQLNSRLPQANQINPGLFPDYKVTVGLPVLSSTYVSFNGGGLSFNNAFTRSADDSLHFNPQKLSSNLKETNRLEVSSNVQLFYLGFRVNKNYFSLGLNERIDGGLTYPRSFIQLIASGNGESVGGVIAFDNFAFRAQAYHELAIGYGRDITEKLSVGVRGKILSGIGGIDTDNISAALATSIDSLYFASSAFNVNSSSLESLFGDGDIFKTATAFKNRGFAIDLGAHYWITDKLRVSLSATDIGSIKWSNDTQQIQFKEVKYSFTGVDFLAVLDESKETDLFSTETDSLRNLFEPDTLVGLTYKTKLSPKIYAGASYRLGKHHTFGALLYGDVFKGTFNPAFGLSYNLELGHIWTVGVNASYQNKSFSNFGIGTTLTLGPVQLYVLSENVMSFRNIGDANLVDARVGMNLVFGKIRDQPKRRAGRSKKVKEVEEIDQSESDSVELAPTTVLLNEEVITAVMGNAENELSTGFYVIIAGFDTETEANDYNQQLVDEGYAVLSGFQSEHQKYYTYLMYYPEDGNRAIEQKNDLGSSFAPGLDKPWVLQVKEE